MKLKLEFPNKSHENMWNKVINEWGIIEEIPTSPAALFQGENFNEFLELIK